MPDLGARLLRAGLLTREQLARALARGPAQGTPLVPALVDAGLSEETLAGFFLADGCGPLCAREALEAADPDLVLAVPAAMARALLALPLARRDGQALIAMADPTDRDAISELHRVLGPSLLPRVARLSELMEALERHYPSTPATMSDPPLSLVRRRRPLLPEDDDVLPLVRTKAVDHVTTPAPPAPRPSTPAVFARSPPTRPYAAPPRRPRPERRSSRPSPSTDSLDDRWGDLTPPPPSPAPTPFVPSAPPPSMPPRRQAAPLPMANDQPPGDVGGVLAGLRTSKNRDEAVRLTCEGALTVARSVVFLARRRAVLEGRTGIGPGLSEDAVRHLWIPVGAASVFEGPVERGEPYLGPWGVSAADALLRAATASRGGTLLVQPVLLGDRTAGVLCLDEPRQGRGSLARVEVLAQALGRTFERLIAEGRR